jgi:hypothetical protein
MKSLFTRIVIGLIVANAAFAIFVLLGGDIGDVEGRILGTSLIATASAILAMACAPALSKGRLGFVPHLGMAAAAAGFVAVTIFIWADIDSLTLGKIAGSAYVVAGAAALACLLSGWRLQGGSAWVGMAANLLIAAVAAMILLPIWTEVGGEGGYWRMFAIVAVLLSASVLAVPVLHRGGGGRPGDQLKNCPFCGAPIEGTAGRPVTCGSCGRRYTVNQ